MSPLAGGDVSLDQDARRNWLGGLKMQSQLFFVPPEFTIVENILNSNVQSQKDFISNPVSVFHAANIALPDASVELLKKLTVFIEERVSIADPVTMIYE